MALIDTLNAIQWWNSWTNPWTQSTDLEKAVIDFTAGEQSQITSYITSLYASGTAASTMEQARGNLTTIRIGKSVDPDYPAFVDIGATGQPYLGFNNTEVAQIWYFNTSGTLVAEIPMLTLIHEFAHTIGKKDPTGAVGGTPTEADENSANWDFEGSALRLQNDVARELSLTNNIQASYHAALGGPDSRRSQFTLGANYTDNETIKIARIGDANANNLDMTARTDDSRDLLFGLGGDDTLKGGGGRDFIYGGEGEDKIWGGEGDDVLVGEDQDDEFRGEKGDDIIWGGNKDQDQGAADGVDSVDYSQTSGPITVTFDGSGATPSLTVKDGEGGTDTLHSIEEILATSGRDVFKFLGDIPAGYDLTIDAAGGQSEDDILNFGQVNSGLEVAITATGGTLTSTATGGQIELVNFHTQIIGSAYDDTITDDSSGGKRIDGGSGNDTITVSTGAAMIKGGDGDDTITGGAGNDVLAGEAGTNVP